MRWFVRSNLQILELLAVSTVNCEWINLPSCRENDRACTEIAEHESERALDESIDRRETTWSSNLRCPIRFEKQKDETLKH